MKGQVFSDIRYISLMAPPRLHSCSTVITTVSKNSRKNFQPHVGSPELGIQLARCCCFGKLLSFSTSQQYTHQK